MELAMATVVIGSLYKNPKAEFLLSDSESSWYGKNTNLIQAKLLSIPDTLGQQNVFSAIQRVQFEETSYSLYSKNKNICYLEVFAIYRSPLEEHSS